MARAVPLDKYKERLAGLPANSFIGSILWFSITGNVERPDGKRSVVPVRVAYDTLVEWFDELDLDPRYLPPVIKKVDVFRKVTSDIKQEYPVDGDRKAKLRVVEVDFNPEFVLRHVMREVIDPRGQTVTTAHCATLKFFRGARTSAGKRHSMEHYKTEILTNLVELGLDGKPTGKSYAFPKAERGIVEDALKKCQAAYEDRGINLHSDALRAVIRDYLISLNAISVKPNGAVYFVHNSRQPTIDSLQKLVTRIGQGCSFHQVPLLDTHEQREMLTDAFQNEVEDDIRLLLADIAMANDKSKKKGGKLSPKRYADFNARLSDVMSRADEYTRVLGLAQGRSAAALELGMDTIMDMSTRVDAKGY